jgi:hypothetical protein
MKLQIEFLNYEYERQSSIPGCSDSAHVKNNNFTIYILINKFQQRPSIPSSAVQPQPYVLSRSVMVILFSLLQSGEMKNNDYIIFYTILCFFK